MIKGGNEGLRRLLRQHDTVPMPGPEGGAGIGYDTGAEGGVYQILNRAAIAGPVGFRDTIDGVTERIRPFGSRRPRLRSLERFDS